MRVRAFSGLASLSVLSFVLLGATGASAKCDPTGADAADVANARAAVAANCDCAGAPNHGTYVKCSATQAKATLVNKSCVGAVQKCAAKSTCGKPGFVTCCKRAASGKVTCATKPNAAACKPPNNGEACVGTKVSCCDACNAANHPPCSPSGAFLESADFPQ